MKKIVIISSVLIAIGLASVAGPVLADGEHDPIFQVKLSAEPRFPIAGEEARLTFKIDNMEGNPLAGQDLMVMLNKNETGGHTHGEAPAEGEAPPGGHDMAEMNVGAADEPVETIHVMPEEVSPGVYTTNVTFKQGGRYVATVALLGEEVDAVLGVRSGPIAWGFIGGLAGLVVILGGMVAVVKTARRSW